MKIEPGWYWVKVKAESSWEVAFFYGGTWATAGSDESILDRDFAIIGPRIEEPK